MITLAPSTTTPNTYSLNWSTQQAHIFDGLRDLVGQEDVLLTDVTLACDGEYIQGHKLVLALCSSFFRDLFQKNRADKSNTIIILGNVSAKNLRYLLQFMYQGKVDIPSTDVDSFLQAGNMLKVEGLIGNVGDSEMQSKAYHQQERTSHNVSTGESPRGNFTKVCERSQMAYSQPSVPTPSASANTGVSMSRCESSVPSKRPRLGDPGPSAHQSASASINLQTSPAITSPPVIVGEPITLSISNQQQSSSELTDRDPLDDPAHYNVELENEIEEGIDFKSLKQEPIQVYSTFEEGDHDQTDSMTHSESSEDIYGGSVEASFALPSSSSAVSVATMSMPGPSTKNQSQSVPRPRGSVPGNGRNTDGGKSNRHNRNRSIIWDHFKRLEEGGLKSRKARCGLCGAYGRSNAWQYFTRVEGRNGIVKYVCKICQATSVNKKRNRSTSNILRHLRRSHPNIFQ